MKKVMAAWCRRAAVDPDGIRFLYEDRRVVEGDTFSSLGMEDGDQIRTLEKSCILHVVINGNGQ